MTHARVHDPAAPSRTSPTCGSSWRRTPPPGPTQRSLIELDVRVHRFVYRVSRNPYLAQDLDRCLNMSLRIWQLTFDRLPLLADRVRKHRDLLEAIARGGRDAAREMARRHVLAVAPTCAPCSEPGAAADGVCATDARAMARQAEAERERRAKVISAEGEYQASTKLSDAAEVISHHPIALQLRYLQTLLEISSTNNTTTVLGVPLDLLRAFSESPVPAIPANGEIR